MSLVAGPPSSTTARSMVRNIMDYGAAPDGKTLNTTAFQRSIDDAHRAGGGTVYAPPGTYLTGGIELKSRVTLYLEAGCVLLGSTSLSDYAFHPGNDVRYDVTGYHLIFAQDAEDITLCGLGTIDGKGESNWYKKVDLPPILPSEAWRYSGAWDYVPRNHNYRPSPMVEFVRCRNVHVSGITLMNSPSWDFRVVLCNSVFIDGIRVRNPIFGRNTDGLDISGSSNVFISNCDIVCGDDAICLKSENSYGETVPTRNITISNCTITTSCNAFKLGTASLGAFENIVLTNCVFYAASGSPLNTRVIGGVNLEVADGGSIDGIVVSNIRMENVRTPIFVRLEQRKKTKAVSFLRNVLIDGIEASGAVVTSSITGVPGLHPSDITVSNCRIRMDAGGKSQWAHREIPELVNGYPESNMMGRLPAYAFYLRHADRVRLRNIECITDKADSRPAVVCDHVDDVVLDGLELSTPQGGAPLFDLRDTRRAFLTGMRSPLDNQLFAQVSGDNSSQVTLLGNSLNAKEEAIHCINGASTDAVRVG